MRATWIFTRLGVVYLSFWVAVAAVYEALFLLSPDIDLGLAVSAGLTIIGVPAMLGLLVVTMALRYPSRFERPMLLIFCHLFGAVAYSLVWVLVVMAVRNVELWLTTETFMARIPPAYVVRWHILAGAALYAAMVIGVYAMRVIGAAETERERAEMRALRAQLNPHFMFNTLHTISMLFRRDASKAEAALEVFSDLVRYALAPPRSANGFTEQDHRKNWLVSMGEEWWAAEKYLNLEHLRLGSRLRVEQDIDENALDGLIPPLVLQPLLENAIVHGAAIRENGAQVSIAIKKLPAGVQITINNEIATPPAGDPITPGIGLSSVKARLEKAFGGDVTLSFDYLSKDIFQARMSLPFWSNP